MQCALTMKEFAPNTRSMARVKMSRCMYAQLMQVCTCPPYVSVQRVHRACLLSACAFSRSFASASALGADDIHHYTLHKNTLHYSVADRCGTLVVVVVVMVVCWAGRPACALHMSRHHVQP